MRKAISNPRLAVDYALRELRRRPVQWYLSRTSNGEPIRRQVYGVELLLDPSDIGISSHLLSAGVHERRSVEAFRAELRTLAAAVDGPITCLDIGANIGYYSFQMADLLGDRAHVHAFEPVPHNRDRLVDGIELNGFSDQFSVHRSAVGDSDGTVTMYLSNASNWNMILTPPREIARTFTGDRIEVPITSIDSFLSAESVAPESVHVVRFDTEGYELPILDGMTRVLDTEGPLLLFLELHPHIVGYDEVAEALDRLECHGLELAAATSPAKRSLTSFDAIRNLCKREESIGAPEVIVKRGF